MVQYCYDTTTVMTIKISFCRFLGIPFFPLEVDGSVDYLLGEFFFGHGNSLSLPSFQGMRLA